MNRRQNVDDAHHRRPPTDGSASQRSRTATDIAQDEAAIEKESPPGKPAATAGREKPTNQRRICANSGQYLLATSIDPQPQHSATTIPFTHDITAKKTKGHPIAKKKKGHPQNDPSGSARQLHHRLISPWHDDRHKSKKLDLLGSSKTVRHCKTPAFATSRTDGERHSSRQPGLTPSRGRGREALKLGPRPLLRRLNKYDRYKQNPTMNNIMLRRSTRGSSRGRGERGTSGDGKETGETRSKEIPTTPKKKNKRGAKTQTPPQAVKGRTKVQGTGSPAKKNVWSARESAKKLNLEIQEEHQRRQKAAKAKERDDGWKTVGKASKESDEKTTTGSEPKQQQDDDSFAARKDDDSLQSLGGDDSLPTGERHDATVHHQSPLLLLRRAEFRRRRRWKCSRSSPRRSSTPAS